MKKMNSFGPSSPPTLTSGQAPTESAPVAQGAAKAPKQPGKLSKQLSKSSSISKDEEREETLEEKSKKFEGEGVTFKAKLVGSELVMEPRGDKMCQNSIQRLKAIIKGQKVHKQRIVMKISYSGVKVYDEKTNEILHHHEVPQISFIASDDTDSRTFGYVCDVPSKAHQFICFRTAGPALQVMSVISTLFEAVLEKKKQAEAGSATPAQAAPVTSTPNSADSVAGRQHDKTDERAPATGKAKSSPFDDDDFGRGPTAATARATSGDSNNKDAINTSDLISSSAEESQLAAGGNNGERATDKSAADDFEDGGGGGGGLTIKSTGSKKDIRSYFDDLKDLQISKIDHTPPFHLIHSGVGGGDSGIMDSTTFSDWGALSQSGMSRTNSAAQMSRNNSAAGLNRTNSAGGGLLFESHYGASAGAPQPPTSLYYTTPISSATTTPLSPMTPFGVSPPDPLRQHQHQHQHQHQQQQRQPSQPAASQAMFIPQRLQSTGGGGGVLGGQQPTPNMMVPNQHQQSAAGPNAASQGAFFEPAHSNMIVGSAPMNQLSHYQMSQHARFSSSMVAGLHQRLGSSAASIQSTGSAGVLSRQTNPFDDEFFA